MKAPNLVSLLVFLGALIPLAMRLVEETWPADTYWWSALLVALLGVAVKAIQEYLKPSGEPVIESTPGPHEAPVTGTGPAYAPRPDHVVVNVPSFLTRVVLK